MSMVDAIFGDEIDRDAYVNREALLYAVQREIFCKASGAILDIRTAVLTTVSLPNGHDVMLVRTGEAYDTAGGLDQVKATAERYGATYEIIDGRDYTAKGTLTVKARKRIEAERAAQA